MAEITRPALSNEDVAQFLSLAKSYREPGPVELRETHISKVFLTPQSAYKLLKPVTFDFLDFSTREARYIDCWQEVALNRRLAADVYLDAVPITIEHGQLKIGGTGDCIDWMVHMRRLSDDATLQARIEQNVASPSDIDRLLDVLCPFFEASASKLTLSAEQALSILRDNVEQNLAGLRAIAQRAGLRDGDLDRLASSQLQFLTLNEDLFRERVHAGWVRDGHGDLRAEHVYLDDPVVVVDCIEFNSHFRYVDCLDDICFLASDLERLGSDDLAERLVGEYRRRLNDEAPESLERFYKSYRASVRAKVACLQAEQNAGESRSRSLNLGKRHLDHAIGSMEGVHAPWLIVVFGLSGMGKSTVAIPLAQQIGARLFRSDQVRKELYGLGPTDRSTDAELYGPEATQRTYEALRDSARRSLAKGASVVLDATFLRRHDRDFAAALAAEMSVPVLFVECHCPPDEARRRIQQRQSTGTDVSDAGVGVLESQLRMFEEPTELATDEFQRIETTRPPLQLVGQIVRRLSLVYSSTGTPHSQTR